MSNIMYTYFQVVFIYFSFFTAFSRSTTIEPDYYWRVYRGIIPKDAIEGGRIEGEAIYIGLITIPNTNGLIPANIYQNETAATASVNGRAFKDDRFVLILCAQQKDKFKWLPASTEYMPNNPVEAGTEKDQYSKVYIGRAHYKNILVIGKVFEGDCQDCGIWFPSSDRREEHHRLFEVLTHLQ